MCIIQRDDQTSKFCPSRRDREANPQGSEGHHTHTHTHTHTHAHQIQSRHPISKLCPFCGIEGNAQETEGHAHLSRIGLQGRRRASNQGTLDLSRHKSRLVCPQQPGTQILYQKTGLGTQLTNCTWWLWIEVIVKIDKSMNIAGRLCFTL